MVSYNPSEVEPKWQKKWEEEGAYTADLKKAKDPYLSMVMFPYPSGDKLHVGHWYNFGPADCFSRFMRMNGKDVFSPIGFDAFGLPAENYAIKTGIHPTESIETNTQTMTEQLKRIGCMYDWSKTVNTSKPEYYQWTQWLFLQMFKNDLAYRKDAMVNYCPDCQTVLANEQVWDGKCERCENDVVQKTMQQWFWKITDFADRLLDGLDSIDWPKKTKVMQRNWIARKEGIDIDYEVESCSEVITCFTTRPDTNFGATFIVLAPEHPFVTKIVNGELSSSNQDEVVKYVKESSSKTELQRQEEGHTKTGAYTGYDAVNNLNGKKLPIWIGDFVLSTVGTGAVVGVPGHDERDFDFAREFDIPIVRVVIGSDGDESEITTSEQVQEKEGTMVNSDFLDGMEIMDAKEKIKDHIEKKGWGRRVVTFRLRDWLISRQRYWGAPIPIVYDPEGNPYPIPEEHLPWELPTDVEFKPTGTAPLAQSKELKERTEKIFGKGWTPEVDTMDTFVCSSFYQLRYLAEGSKKEIVPKDIEKKWAPVDMYIGGPEHACMHLIYTRFVAMALTDFGFLSHEEPFQRLVHQGLITNDGAKMSKSKGNVVSPDSFVEKYGSDTFRMYLMFMGPFTQGGDWSDTGIKGVDRFVQRMWRVFESQISKEPRTSPSSADGGLTTIQGKPQGKGKKSNTKVDQDAAVTAKLHATIKKVTVDTERLHFNTSLSALMELLNLLEKQEEVSVEIVQTFAKLLAPLAPHLAEELWELTGGEGFVIDQAWPTYDESKLKTDTVTIAVQINGKIRGEFTASTDVSEAEAIALAKADENVQKHLDGKDVKKEIYIPGKLVSLVIEKD